MTQKHEPTEKLRAEVLALASFGVPQDDIAIYVDIDPKTLRKHYRRELDIGEIKANAAVAKRLYEQATTDSVTAAIFWLKARAGWREKIDLNHSGNIGLHELSEDELQRRKEQLERELENSKRD